MKVLLKGKKAILFLFFIIAGGLTFLLGGYLFGADKSKEIIDWDKVKSSWETYLKAPYPECAKAFLDTLPKDKTENAIGDESKTIDYIYDFQNYSILESEIWRGKRYLIEAGFRMLNFADGAFAEALWQTLSTLAQINPWLFLEVLYEYKNLWLFKYTGYPVDGSIYEEPKAIIAETELRIKALKSVKDKKYIELRDACIRQIRKTLKEYLEKINYLEKVKRDAYCL